MYFPVKVIGDLFERLDITDGFMPEEGSPQFLQQNVDYLLAILVLGGAEQRFKSASGCLLEIWNCNKFNGMKSFKNNTYTSN